MIRPAVRVFEDSIRRIFIFHLFVFHAIKKYLRFLLFEIIPLFRHLIPKSFTLLQYNTKRYVLFPESTTNRNMMKCGMGGTFSISEILPFTSGTQRGMTEEDSERSPIRKHVYRMRLERDGCVENVSRPNLFQSC
jgi:hypothetical protein